MQTTKEMTFLKACMDFFGLKENQTPMLFAKEVKALSDEDKAEIKAGLEQNGYKIVQAAI